MAKKKKRALVISGGGAKGAWGGGVVQALIEKKKLSWDKYYGCSTGSLLITLTSLGEMEKLKDAYTSVDENDIFSVKPFNKKGNIRVLNAVWRIIRGKTSLGESGNLINKVREFFPEESYKKVKESGKEIICTVTNYTLGKVDYISSETANYNDYIDFTIASTSVPIAMDFVRKYGLEYLDGGVMEHVPLQKAIDDGADEIDIVIMRPENYPQEAWKSKNILQVFMRTIDCMEREVSASDVLIGKLLARKSVTLNFYYPTRVLTKNSLLFNKAQMTVWWDEGYFSVDSKTYEVKTYKLRARRDRDK